MRFSSCLSSLRVSLLSGQSHPQVRSTQLLFRCFKLAHSFSHTLYRIAGPLLTACTVQQIVFVASAAVTFVSTFTPATMAQGGDLKSLFLSFAGYGTRSDQQELEGSKFKKLCTDCGLLDKKFTVTDVDLIFVKSKTKGSQKLTFPEFEKALELIAEKKGVSLDDLKSKLNSASGPKTQATTPDYVKFHDDKSTYTGVYANGGPTNVDGKGDLSELCDRSDANVRGVTQKFANSH